MIAAWVSVALIPVGVLLAIVIGEALASALGGGGAGVGVGIMLGAGLPAVVVMLLAPIAAVVCGVRARRFGRPLAVIPIIIGALAIAWSVLANSLPWLIAGIFGV
jgi:ABC-type antimicrobial peptide transport system permease subunit